jgi:hypothetical protein
MHEEQEISFTHPESRELDLVVVLHVPLQKTYIRIIHGINLQTSKYNN